MPPEAVAPLLELLKSHPSLPLRKTLVKGLPTLVQQGALTFEHFLTIVALQKENTDPEVKQGLQQTLFMYGNSPTPSADKFLALIKNEKDEQVLQMLSQILQQQCNRAGITKESVKMLFDQLKTHPSVNVRRNLSNSMNGLIRTGAVTVEDFSTMLDIAKNNADPGVKQAIMQSLVSFGSAPVQNGVKFMEMLQSEKDETMLSVLAQIVRAQAARRDFPKDKIQEYLNLATSHSNASVRQLLSQWIPQMCYQGAITMENFPALLQIMKAGKDPQTKGSVAQAFNALTRQNLGVEPGPWEKWWEQNKAAYAPKPTVTPTPRITPAKPTPRPTPTPRAPRKR
jgi:hypothetical protein